MLYEKLKNLSAANFKRYCGVERRTFDKMCDVVRQKSSVRRIVEGRPPKLATEDQVLLTLEYWREYRTMFHLATNWGVSEFRLLFFCLAFRTFWHSKNLSLQRSFSHFPRRETLYRSINKFLDTCKMNNAVELSGDISPLHTQD